MVQMEGEMRLLLEERTLILSSLVRCDRDLQVTGR
jgi:hypothetical protein